MTYVHRSRHWSEAVTRPLFEFAERYVFGSRPPEYEAIMMDAARLSWRGTAYRSPPHIIVRAASASTLGPFPKTYTQAPLYGRARFTVRSPEELIVMIAAHEMQHVRHHVSPQEPIPQDLREHLLAYGGARTAVRAGRTYNDLELAQLHELDTTRVGIAAGRAWIVAHQPTASAVPEVDWSSRPRGDEVIWVSASFPCYEAWTVFQNLVDAHQPAIWRQWGWVHRSPSYAFVPGGTQVHRERWVGRVQVRRSDVAKVRVLVARAIREAAESAE